MDFIGKKMIIDTDEADGGVYFYDQYFEFISRDLEYKFTYYYKDITDVIIRRGIKSTVTLKFKDGTQRKFYMHKVNTFVALINSGREYNKESVDIDLTKKDEIVKEEENTSKEVSDDLLTKIERLNALKEKGAITIEEYEKLKREIIK